jgi:hypothetical protein|tara:strand:+ start:5 stop:403 length:399 start_codon:yes stop_codon:yes gene_type:complete
MKKLLLLILLVIVSLKCFSQIDTTKISLEEPIVRLIIKDLIEGDGVKEELSLTLEKVLLLDQKIVLKDSIISTNVQQIDNYNSIISSKSEQVKISQELTSKLENDLQKQKRKNKITIAASIAAIVLILLAGN